ncbi:MAG: caspase family protein, partial [Thermoguttaceae bacterium]|nr:caspase family protein [Thermoguttaceae bacterium]MBQ9128102.1 caspase family protein [Thermoguttaceae bacterium]
MKTKKWGKGALALGLALGLSAFAEVADAQFKVPILNSDGAAARAEQTDERPASSERRKNATRVQAERIWREVAGEATRAEESTGKRYLVNFIATSYYDYEANKEIAEPLLPCVVGSYCVSTLALNWCDVDETITISGKYLNKKQIDNVFDILAKKTEPNDEIFVYWNGHAGPVSFSDADGVVTRDDLGVKDEADGCDEYLSLYECFKPVRNLEEAREQRMIDDDLAANFKKLAGRRVTAFFEVCHAAGLANPEQVQITGRPRTLQNGASRFSDGPELPCVDTWEKLKSEADSTSEWLSVENAQAALQFISWELRVDENGSATPIENDDATEENDDASEESGEESGDASLSAGARLFD